MTGTRPGAETFAGNASAIHRIVVTASARRPAHALPDFFKPEH